MARLMITSQAGVNGLWTRIDRHLPEATVGEGRVRGLGAGGWVFPCGGVKGGVGKFQVAGNPGIQNRGASPYLESLAGAVREGDVRVLRVSSRKEGSGSRHIVLALILRRFRLSQPLFPKATTETSLVLMSVFRIHGPEALSDSH